MYFKIAWILKAFYDIQRFDEFVIEQASHKDIPLERCG